MSKAGEKLIAAARELAAVLSNDLSAAGMLVTPSCGCTFCDLNMKPVKLRRQYVHYGLKYGLVVCPISGIKRSSATDVA